MPVDRLLGNKTGDRRRSRRRAGNKACREGLPVDRSSPREPARERNGLTDALGTRPRSAALQTSVASRTSPRTKRSHRRAGNQTERQTVSSTRWEQDPGALPVKPSEALPNQRSVPPVEDALDG